MSDGNYIRGADIEVFYWKPRDRAAADATSRSDAMQDRSNWFRATIVEVAGRYAIRQYLVAKIRYQQVGNFPWFEQDVLVWYTRGHDRPTLQCMLTGTHLSWRFRMELNHYCIEEARRDGPASNVRGTQAGEEGGLLRRPKRPKMNADDNNRKIVTSTPAGSDEIHKSIECRLAYLEASLVVQGESLSRLQSGVRHEALSAHSRPLIYLRLCLNKILYQAPSRTAVKRADTESKLACDVLSAHGDCSLAEFESLSLHVLSSSNRNRISLNPACTSAEIPRLHHDLLCIHFTGLKDMLDIIGLTPHSVLAENMVKASSTRKNSRHSICRVFGQVLCRGRRGRGPMCITVGHAYRADLYDQMPDNIPVLIREDTSWNAMDEEYENDMLLKTVTKLYCQEIRTKFGDDASAQVSRKGRRKKSYKTASRDESPQCFNIWWQRVSERSSREIISNPNSAREIAGRIYVEVPTVIICDSSMCAEVMELCTKQELQRVGFEDRTSGQAQ